VLDRFVLGEYVLAGFEIGATPHDRVAPQANCDLNEEEHCVICFKLAHFRVLFRVRFNKRLGALGG
jgi:hypothetical protein